MGNTGSVCTLTKDEINTYMQQTCCEFLFAYLYNFDDGCWTVSAQEIRALWFHFKDISSSQKDDNLIDRK